MEILFLLWLVISCAGALMMVIDKHNAKMHKKRISEKTLILAACFGASFFMWITMYLIHHKTKHMKFTIGLPMIAAVQLFLIFICLSGK